MEEVFLFLPGLGTECISTLPKMKPGQDVGLVRHRHELPPLTRLLGRRGPKAVEQLTAFQSRTMGRKSENKILKSRKK